MAWSRAKPDDNGIIRSAPSEIRANWDEIEQNDTGVYANALNQWSVHLLDRNHADCTGPAQPVSIDDVGMLYCNNSSGSNQLYYQDGESSANRIQLTRSTEVTDAANGQTFLPGGFLIQWFTAVINKSTVSSGLTTITFPTEFPSNCYNVTFSCELAGTSNQVNDVYIVAGTLDKTDFQVKNPNNNAFTIYVQAIGK